MAPTRFEALLNAYTAERTDDTQTVTSMFGLLTASIGLITLIGFALVNRESVPGWLIALAPTLPIPFIAFGALLTQVAQIRGRLIDEYEREIRVIVRAADDSDDNLIPYGHTVLDRLVWDAPYSRIIMGVSFLTFLGGYVAVITECFRYSRGTDFGLALTGLVSSTAATALLIGLFGATLFPHHWLRKGLAELARVEGAPQGRSEQEESRQPIATGGTERHAPPDLALGEQGPPESTS
jgi:hypothetical protein